MGFPLECPARQQHIGLSIFLYSVFGYWMRFKIKIRQTVASVTNQLHEFLSLIFWREMMWRRLWLSFRISLEFPARQQHIGLPIYLYSRLLLSIKFLLGFNFLTCRMESGTSEVAHSGYKWP